MKPRVVDTNVAIVANGRNTNATIPCREAAIHMLAKILAKGKIVTDDAGEMLREYRSYCNPKGEPGVGDRFFRELLVNYGSKVERVTLDRRADGSYADFPEAAELDKFHQDDRKFAAAARKMKVAVLNATDSDWLDHLAALNKYGIKVEFVCGAAKERWFAAAGKPV